MTYDHSGYNTFKDTFKKKNIIKWDICELEWYI
jgi:hypothetical protein